MDGAHWDCMGRVRGRWVGGVYLHQGCLVRKAALDYLNATLRQRLCFAALGVARHRPHRSALLQ